MPWNAMQEVDNCARRHEGWIQSSTWSRLLLQLEDVPLFLFYLDLCVCSHFAIGERQNDIMGLRLEHFGIKICLCPELCITTNLEMAAKGEGKKQMQFDCFFNLPPSYKTCFRNGHQADLASRR